MRSRGLCCVRTQQSIYTSCVGRPNTRYYLCSHNNLHTIYIITIEGKDRDSFLELLYAAGLCNMAKFEEEAVPVWLKWACMVTFIYMWMDGWMYLVGGLSCRLPLLSDHKNTRWLNHT